MRIFTIYILLLTVLISCEKLEEVGGLSPSTSELQGKWELQSATCFCFYPDDFDFNAHQLTFSATAEEVIIENSDDTIFITGAGTYPVVIENDRFTIKDSIAYTYRIAGDTLTTNFVDNPQIADDEISLTYLKQ